MHYTLYKKLFLCTFQIIHMIEFFLPEEVRKGKVKCQAC